MDNVYTYEYDIDSIFPEYHRVVGDKFYLMGCIEREDIVHEHGFYIDALDLILEFKKGGTEFGK